MTRPTPFELKMGFGYLLLVGLFAMTMITALGTVTASSSYGLPEMIHTFEMLASGFIGWMAGHDTESASITGTSE